MMEKIRDIEQKRLARLNQINYTLLYFGHGNCSITSNAHKENTSSTAFCEIGDVAQSNNES
jgi:hypothetical protein